MSGKVLAWLSVWSEVQMICIWSRRCHCCPIISFFIKTQNGLTLLVPAYPDCQRKEPVKRVSVLFKQQQSSGNFGSRPTKVKNHSMNTRQTNVQVIQSAATHVVSNIKNFKKLSLPDLWLNFFTKWLLNYTVSCYNFDTCERILIFFMAALCNRGAIIFLPRGFFLSIFYLLSFSSSPNLSGHRLDVYHTSTHGMALVRI